jgi:hypothetical protein
LEVRNGDGPARDHRRHRGGRSKSEVAWDYGVSRVWVQKLVRRYQRVSPAAFEPRSRPPHSNPRAVDLEVEDQIVRLRKTLTKKGVDAGAETIAAHLQMAGVSPVPAVSTIWRICRVEVSSARSRRNGPGRRGEPSARSSQTNAGRPTSHWRLADGSVVEILNILDDHSRVNLAAHARRITTGRQVVDTFLTAFGRWWVQASGWLHTSRSSPHNSFPGGQCGSERQGSAAIARPCVSVDDLGRLQRTLDSDLDAVAERLGKAAEDWLRTWGAKAVSWTTKECCD